MNAVPDSTISITIDEDALRKQVKGILTEEANTMAMRLRAAANQLDPTEDARRYEYAFDEGVRHEKARAAKQSSTVTAS